MVAVDVSAPAAAAGRWEGGETGMGGDGGESSSCCLCAVWESAGKRRSSEAGEARNR